MITKYDNPCRNCPDRTENCHTYCADWLEFKAEYDEAKRISEKREKGVNDYYAVKKAAIAKTMKHYKPQGRSKNGKQTDWE